MLDQPRGIGWLGQIGAAKSHAYAVDRGNLPAQPAHTGEGDHAVRRMETT
jgi:hypothetical protein